MISPPASPENASPAVDCREPVHFANASPDERAARAELARRWLARCGEDEVVALTSRLVALPTVSSQMPPDGPAFQAMADLMGTWAEERGFSFATVGQNDAWEVGYGEGPRSVLFVTHADVVPASEGDSTDASVTPSDWSVPPFQTTRRDGKLYGRGTEDDKGPIAAALVAFDTLRRFGLPPRGQLTLAMGTGEENDWEGMKRYAAQAPPARFVISADAGYPVVAAQSGFVAWQIGLPAEPATAGARPRLAALHGGHFLTQVPGEASLQILAPAAASAPDAGMGAMLELRAALQTAIAAEKERPEGGAYRFAVHELPGGAGLTVTVTGEAVHSSVAPEGHNALWPLGRIAAALPVEHDSRWTMMRLLAERFAGDHFGRALGLAYADVWMGELLVVPTLLHDEDGRVALGINMRRPAGKSSEAFRTALGETLATLQRDFDARLAETGETYVGEPHVAELDGTLVPTLLDIYRRHTGDSAAKPIAIRGGTYARLFAGGVDFGPALPGAPYRGHAPDEYIELRLLGLAAQMYFDAVLALDGSPL